MKKIQLSIQQDHAKTEEPVRYVKRNTLEIYMHSYLKGKSSNDGTYSNDPTVKSNCAGVGCARATFSQVISKGHSYSDKEVKTFALLDTCSQGTFVTEDLISKLGVSGVKSSINIKTLNGS